MSTEQLPITPSTPRRGPRILSLIGSVLLLVFACQLVLQQELIRRGLIGFQETEAFEDAEQIKQLSDVQFTDTAKPANDWPQWRGPHRDGVSTETGLLTTWPDSGPRQLWEVPMGQGFAAPVVARNRVVGFFLNDDHEHVVCWQADDGKEVWHCRYPASYQNTFGNGPRSTPTIDGDRIFTVGGTGIMHCLDSKGEVVWRKDLLADFNASNIKWGVSFSPLVVGERLFIHPGGPNGNSIAALDKQTGKLLWKNLGDEASYSSPLHATLAGQEQIVFFTAQNLLGVTPDKGELLWSFPWITNAEGCNIGTPIIANDYVFISTGYGKGCALVKIDKEGDRFVPRKVYENNKMRNHFSSSVRLKDHIYGFNENILTCLELRTGKVKWRENGLDKGSLTIADNHLIILGENGLLVIAAADPGEFKETARWEAPLKRNCWTVPVLADGKLYVRDQERMLCLKMRP